MSNVVVCIRWSYYCNITLESFSFVRVFVRVFVRLLTHFLSSSSVESISRNVGLFFA